METAPSDASASSGRETVLIDLALQGGGSHGAFTWGVLDRLLEESWLRIDGISGTSAGAMNAVVLVDGSSTAIDELGASSKFNAKWDFLTLLKVEGRRCAESFLAAHGGNVGKHSTLDPDVLLEQV